MSNKFELIERGPCLLCFGTGTVEIKDPREEEPEIHRCPRGCPTDPASYSPEAPSAKPAQA